MGGCAPSRPLAENGTGEPPPPLPHPHKQFHDTADLYMSSASSFDGTAASTSTAGPCAATALARNVATVDLTARAADAYDVDADIVPFLDEAERLATLLSLGVLERPRETRFDNITGVLRAVFQTPVSAITLIADDTIHFHSTAGDWARKAPRKGSFCDRILEGACPRMLVVEDALADARFVHNKYVSGPPGIRFYAGAPLVGSTGQRYGTLCVIDFVPRRFTAEQYLMIVHFAELATRELERERMQEQGHADLRAALQGAAAAAATGALPGATPGGDILRAMDALNEAVAMADLSVPQWPLVYANAAWASTCGGKETGGLTIDASCTTPPFWQQFSGRTADPAQVAAALAAAQRGEPFTLSVCTAAEDGAPEDVVLTVRFKPVSEPGRLGAAAMPQVAVPSGIGMDWMLAAGHPLPRLGRPNHISSHLDDSKRAALAAALAVVSAGGDSRGGAVAPAIPEGASILDAAAAVAAAAEALQAQEAAEKAKRSEPIYYIAVVLHSSPVPPPPPRHLPASPFASVMLSPPAWSSSTTDSGEHGVLPHAAMVSAMEASPSSCPLPGISAESATAHAQMAAELACSGIQIPRDGADGAAAAAAAAAPSGAWGLRDRPPPALQGLVLGPLVGCGAGGQRCYRGAYRGARAAVKVMDIEEQPGAAAAPAVALDGTPTRDGSVASAVCGALRTLPPHPNLVRVLDCAAAAGAGATGLQVWTVEEFCDRGALGDAVDAGLLRGGDGRRDAVAVLAAARDVAAGMTALHATGAVHGGLNGGAVLVTTASEDGRGWRAVVCDYALALAHSPSECGDGRGDAILDNGDCAACGVKTPKEGQAAPARLPGRGQVAHLPAEVLLGAAVTPATDAYSFGVLLWEMWNGKRAWRHLPPLGVVHAVALQRRRLEVPKSAPPAVADLMQRCMAEDPGMRPSFNEILPTLEWILS